MNSRLLLLAVALTAGVAVSSTAAAAAPAPVYRLLQAEFGGQKIGSRTYSAEGVSCDGARGDLANPQRRNGGSRGGTAN